MNVADRRSIDEENGLAEALHCYRHPGTETLLRCGRCERPICTRCQISTPVGMRCRECAQVKRIALANRPTELAIAAAAGLGTAIAGTLVLDVLLSTPYLGMFGIFAYAALGYVVGWATSSAAKGKRSRDLAIVAVVTFALGYLLAAVAAVTFSGRPVSAAFLLALVLGMFRSITLLAGLFVGGLLAWMRAR